MNEDLLRFRHKQKYITWDLETSNLAISNEKPWQIGYVIHHGKNLIQEIERKIFWPNYDVSDEVARFNHFDRYQYKQEARDAMEVLEQFESYLYDPEYIVITINGLGFDQFVHNNWRRALRKKTDYSWNKRHVDILPVFRALQMGCKTVDRNDLFCWQMRYLNHRDRKIKASLEAQMKYFSLPYNPDFHHNAVWDVQATFEVFQKLIWAIEI